MALMAGFAIGKIAKSIWDGITLKGILQFVAACAVAWLLYTAYNWVLERGKAQQLAEDTVIIDALKEDLAEMTTERDEAIARRDLFVSAYDKLVADTAAARKQQQEQNAATVARLERQLLAAQKDAKKKQELLDDLTTYLPENIGSLELPAGFVSLYNLSLEGRPDQDPAFPGIPRGFQGDAAAPTGITVSDFAHVFVGNNAEAVQRGVVIKAWQDWYAESKQQFTAAQQAAAENIPRLEELSEEGSETDGPERSER